MNGERFEKGDPVELVHTEDQLTNLAPGARGTVAHVDDTGTVHVRWDGGSTLGMIPGKDIIRRVLPLTPPRTQGRQQQ